MLQKKVVLVLAILFNTLIACSQTTNFNFTNKPFSDPEVNNYGRGAQYWNGTTWGTGAAPQVPPGTSHTGAKTLYSRYWWSDCERGQGEYTLTKASLGGDFWKSIEWSLEWCANNGALYGFGNVMTSWDGQGTIFYDGGWSVYPQYLHNLMQAESTTKDWKYANGNIWVPNWNSPSYLARWKALNEAIYNYIINWTYTPTSGPWAGKLVRGKDILDFVDIRGFGNYGEWHTYPWGDDGSEPAFAKATDSTFKKLIDIGADVWGEYSTNIPVGAFDDNPWGEGTAFTAWYVLTRKTKYGVIGWRRDNIGDVGIDEITLRNGFTGPNGWKGDTAIVNRWKYAMITGEPLNGGGTCCPYYWHVRSELNNFHYSQFGNGNYGSTAQSVFDSMQVYFKMSGYRYNLNGGSMTSVLSPSQNFNVTLNWRNVGVAPIYQKRWRVVYQLKTAGDVEVKKWVSKFKPYLFLPNNIDSVVTDQFNLGIVPEGTTYKLTVKIEDSLGIGLLAPLFIAINSPTRNADGSYTLRSNIVVTGALPVNWISFSGVSKGSYNEIRWKTTCNDFNQKYEPEKSIDGKNWDMFAIVNSVNKCSEYEYTANDYNVKSDFTFYRIKQYDLDGKFQYSNIIKVPTDRIVSKYQLIPNPARDELTVAITDSEFGNTKIDMFDAMGKLVYTYQIQKQSVFINPMINLSRFANGIYTVRISINGKQKSISKLVKT